MITHAIFNRLRAGVTVYCYEFPLHVVGVLLDTRGEATVFLSPSRKGEYAYALRWNCTSPVLAYGGKMTFPLFLQKMPPPDLMSGRRESALAAKP